LKKWNTVDKIKYTTPVVKKSAPLPTIKVMADSGTTKKKALHLNRPDKAETFKNPTPVLLNPSHMSP
jgi:hypothetical protein